MRFIVENTALKYLLEDFPRRLIKETWKKFEEQCNSKLTVSEFETKKILERELLEVESINWLEKSKEIFIKISENESIILGNLISEELFDFYISNGSFSRRLPICLPFIICIAINQKRTIVYRKGCKDYDMLSKICREKSINLMEVEDYLLKINSLEDFDNLVENSNSRL